MSSWTAAEYAQIVKDVLALCRGAEHERRVLVLVRRLAGEGWA